MAKRGKKKSFLPVTLGATALLAFELNRRGRSAKEKRTKQKELYSRGKPPKGKTPKPTKIY
tara:strand:+ start:300 stop:482 length:183 start_codon:yes stop_codon:yes gene_type:complete